MILQNLTFTGIDSLTDIDDLVGLSKDYPNIRFGFRTSSDWRNLGYPNPTEIRRLGHPDLSYVLVIDNVEAQDILNGDWNVIINRFGNSFRYFSAVQLNLGRQKFQLRYALRNVPENIKEIIIQQTDSDDLNMYKYLKRTAARENFKVSLLVDGSGGKGFFCTPTEELFLQMSESFGFAGGLNPKNCRQVFDICEQYAEILELPYWLNFESGVKDDFGFNINACRAICEKIYKARKEFAV